MLGNSHSPVRRVAAFACASCLAAHAQIEQVLRFSAPVSTTGVTATIELSPDLDGWTPGCRWSRNFP